ncbi:MAG: hypothetical protein WB510_04210 [Candidatus Sulfotelmatobacter sp.]
MIAALMVAGLAAGAASIAGAQQVAAPSSLVRQSLDDAWWTGPLLANSAGTLPAGHFLFEPYLYDVTSAQTNGFGSRAYVLYGLVNRLTVGLIPIVGYNLVSNGPSSSGVRLGDLTPMAQYRLTQFHEGSWIPTTSVEVLETFPTGKYDRLGNRPSDGIGSGAHTTTLSLNNQTYVWLPNGRILRMRLNVSQAFSSQVNVADASVSNTAAGFRGHANPGSSLFVDAAWEYSLTRRWVPALDVIYHQNGNTPVIGYNSLDLSGVYHPPIRLDSGSSAGFGFAPAIEYSWKSCVGVIFGTRLIAHGRNTAVTITPAIAINIVH